MSFWHVLLVGENVREPVFVISWQVVMGCRGLSGSRLMALRPRGGRTWMAPWKRPWSSEAVPQGPWLLAGWRRGSLWGLLSPPEDRIPPGCCQQGPAGTGPGREFSDRTSRMAGMSPGSSPHVRGALAGPSGLASPWLCLFTWKIRVTAPTGVRRGHSRLMPSASSSVWRAVRAA